MGITKEVAWRAREENILKEEDMVEPKKAKSEAPAPKPKQPKSYAPSSGAHKPVSSPKPQAKPSDEGKRKREQARVFIPVDEEEMESNEAVKEVKAKTAKATKVTKEKPSGGPKYGKKSKFKLDEALKKGKLEVKPPMSLNEIDNEVVKNGDLKPLSEWCDNFDESSKRTLEEATVEYLNVYSKALIELMTIIPKSLYDILDARR